MRNENELEEKRELMNYYIWSNEEILKLEKRVIALENTLKRIGIDIIDDQEN